MAEFNLVDQAWIPCLMSDEARELSLRETLIEAHRVREVFDNSPLVTVALHRLLLAVLHSALPGPQDFDEWKSLWSAKQWEAEKINKYLDEWKHRFDLFHAEWPFYQVPLMYKEMTEKKSAKKKEQSSEPELVKLHPVALLAHEAATGDNATLFDHSFNDFPMSFSPAEAARYLIARQSFSVGGGVSQPFNLSHAPLARGFTVMAQGNNVFETLALNLLIWNKERPVSWKGGVDDAPAWEQQQSEEPDARGTQARGYLDYLTWQSRRIHLIAEGEPPVALRCQLLQNLKLADQPPLFDPFKCYEKNKEEGFKPLGLTPSKALWRDSHALFQQVEDSIRRPEIFNHLARIEIARRHGEIEAHPTYSFAVYGFATEPGKAASVIQWLRERLPLPLSYLDEPKLVEALHNALQLAEKIEEVLADSIKVLAKGIATDQDAVNMARSFGAVEIYWSRLETPFKKLLTDLPSDRFEDEYEEVFYGERVMADWARTLVKTARDALEKATSSLSGSARDFKAITAAESKFNQSIGRIGKDQKFAHLFVQAQSTGGKQ